MASHLKSEDVIVLLKLATLNSIEIENEVLANELGHTLEEITQSVQRLFEFGLIDQHLKVRSQEFRYFILYSVSYLFPARPGPKTTGRMSGAKTDHFFVKGIPETSIFVWPDPYGQDQGWAINPLSPHCSFAALNDTKLKNLLAVVETLRVAGSEARLWAEAELSEILDH